MKHFNQKENAVVGSYVPSSQWNQWTQFAVMDERTSGLLAVVGYFQNINNPKKWKFEDYDHAAECIEQAQLYANAYKLYQLAKSIADNEDLAGFDFHQTALDIVSQIDDISEPVERLLGEDAMKIIESRT